MAITEDATTPAVVNSSGVVSTRVTGSFSPPANSLLIALVACYSSGSNGAITVTDSGGHTWTKSVESIGHTTVAIWQCQLTTAPGSITVTAHYSNNAGDEYLAVRVLNGAGTSQTGAGTAVHLVTSATTADTYSLTTTQTGSVVYGITDNWATTDSITPNAATTLLTGSDFTDTPNGAYIVCWKSTSATGTPGATTFGGTWAAAVTDGNVALEILPPPSAFSVSVTATETASPVIAGARTDTSDVSATSTAPSVVGAQAVGPGAAAAVVSVAPVVSATAVGPAAVSAAGTTGATVIGQRTDTGATTPVASALSTVGATSVGPGAVSATESAGSTVTAQRAQTGTLAAVVTAAPSVSAAVTG
ncbi:MAG: hypothetical protein ACREQ5_25500, partial [Candidatus Dormibacteria bacterium]